MGFRVVVSGPSRLHDPDKRDLLVAIREPRHAAIEEYGLAMAYQRRRFLGGATSLSMVSWRANAQSYPSREVRIVVGFPPGGPLDIAARVIAPWLSERLDRPFAVANHVGASGNIA